MASASGIGRDQVEIIRSSLDHSLDDIDMTFLSCGAGDSVSSSLVSSLMWGLVVDIGSFGGKLGSPENISGEILR